MEVAKLVPEYLKTILSAQVIIGVIALIFFCIFKEEIRSVLKRTKRIAFPGGELSTSQIEKSTEELPAKGEKPKPVTQASSIPQSIYLDSKQLQELEAIFTAERVRASLWEYRYLNYFLARSTQHILDWLANLSIRTTISTFDSIWLTVISNPKERQAILDALQTHYLIEISEGLIEVTPKGKEYLQWRGPLLSENI